MRIPIAAAVLFSLALSPQARGVVSKVATGPADAAGIVQFTVEGRNPCGAVYIDFGDGLALTHAIEALPVTIPHEYSKIGEYPIQAKGMGNCDGDVSAKLRVNRVRPRKQNPPPAPPPPPAGRGRGVGDRRATSVTAIVDSRDDWTDTGLDVRRGEAITFAATGTIQFATQSLATGPDGAAGLRAPVGAPMPKELLGAVIARVGRSAPFLVGAGAERLRAPVDGPLYLRVNDDILDDNRGEFRVSISVTRGRGR